MTTRRFQSISDLEDTADIPEGLRVCDTGDWGDYYPEVHEPREDAPVIAIRDGHNPIEPPRLLVDDTYIIEWRYLRDWREQHPDEQHAYQAQYYYDDEPEFDYVKWDRLVEIMSNAGF